MLLSQHGGGDEHRHLPAIEGCLERGPHRDFGFSVADVAADQPIHRLGLGHVRQHLFDRPGLVRSLFELEIRFELPEEVVRGGERGARMRPARRVELEKLGGHLEQVLLDPLLGLFPGGSAQPVQRRLARIASGELLDQPESTDRKVDLVAAGVLEHQEVARDCLDVHLRQTGVARDSEVGVNDQIAFLELAKSGGEGKLRPFLADPPAGADAEDLLLGDRGESACGIDEPLRNLVGEEVRVNRGLVERARI